MKLLPGVQFNHYTVGAKMANKGYCQPDDIPAFVYTSGSLMHLATEMIEAGAKYTEGADGKVITAERMTLGIAQNTPLHTYLMQGNAYRAITEGHPKPSAESPASPQASTSTQASH